MLSIAALGGQAEVDVTIDRNPVQVNESFQLVFSLDRDPKQNPDFSILQEDFLILGNNRTNSISIINGQYQRSVKWTLQLMAKQVGDYEIPAIRFGDESSEPFRVTVTPSTMRGCSSRDAIGTSSVPSNSGCASAARSSATSRRLDSGTR